MSDVTRILDRVQQGEAQAAEELLPLVYEELRRLAAHKMAHEPAGHTLQPTALVHEAWLRLVGSGQEYWDHRGHFFAAAAEAMRRVLVDNARRKRRLKREAGEERVELEESRLPAPAEDEKVLLVHDALEVLAADDPLKADIVRLRFFVGLSEQEIANLLGVNERTVRRHWELAKIRLFQRMQGGA